LIQTVAAPSGAANPTDQAERWREVMALGEASIQDRTVLAVGGRHVLVAGQFRPVFEHLLSENPVVERDATIASLRKVIPLADAPALADRLLGMRQADSRLEIAWRDWWRGFLRIPLWFPSQRLVETFRGRVLTPNLLSVWAIAVIVAVASLGAQPLPALPAIGGWQLVPLWAMATVTTFVHELGHLLVAAHYGVRARSMGVGLMYVQPAGYTDVTNSWLVRRPARIAIALGGVLFQSVPLVLCYAAWRLTGLPVLGWYCVLSTAWMAFNLLPFVRLDGYWVLSFALDEFNLRQRAFGQLLHTLQPRRVPGSWTGPEAVLAALFGALSGLFTAGMYVSAVAGVQALAPARVSPFVPFVAWGGAVLTLGIALLRRSFTRARGGPGTRRARRAAAR
jgi:hypothetical protein